MFNKMVAGNDCKEGSVGGGGQQEVPNPTVWEDVDLHHANATGDHGNISNDEDDEDPSSVTYRYPGVYRKTAPQYIPGKGVSRYNSALRTLIPIRRTPKKKESLGVDESGMLSFITFTWLSRYMFRAYKKGLTLEELPVGSPLDTCDYNAQRLEVLWQEEMARKGPRGASLRAVVWRFMRTRVLVSTSIFALNIVTGFISVTYFMRHLLEYAETPDASIWEGVKWALGLTLCELFRILFYAGAWSVGCRTAIRLRSACLAMLYRKVIRLNSLGNKTIGELINMFANDSQRIFTMVLFGPMIIGGPVTMTFGTLYILWLLSPWALLGMLVFILFYPIQYGMSRLVGFFQAKVVSVADQRIRLTSDILSCIKLIKMYAWEKSFTKNLFDIRGKELTWLQRGMYCQSLTVSIASTVPIISAIVMFLSHIAMGNNITASQAFSVVCFCLKLLSSVMIFTSESWKCFIEGRNSIRRLQSVMVLNEINPYIAKPMDKSQAVCIANGSFSWDTPPPEESKSSKMNGRRLSQKLFGNSHCKKMDAAQIKEETIKLNNTIAEVDQNSVVLHDINFYARKGSLIGICGQVGAGKSSLLSAALGQMKIINGKVSRDGSCAYVSQQAWILNATLKENILFGEPFNAKRYFHTLHCCCLNDDIDLLPGGDETEIGERGINLSGGQKQRVALARAMYANRDIYFLDDPLSAVDAHVGKHIFNKYILEALKSKTVIFVTHQIQFLNRCDEICVMKEGKIVERGTHDELLSKDGEYAAMVRTWKQSQNDAYSNADLDSAYFSDDAHANGDVPEQKRQRKPSVATPEKTVQNGDATSVENCKKLMVAERVERGTLQPGTYLSYIHAAGGYCVVLTVILLIMFNVGTTAFSSWWLAMWIKAGGGNTTVVVNNVTVPSTNIADNPDFNTYWLVYAMTIVVILASNFIRGLAFSKATLTASKKLHQQLFRKVMTAPMQFFETTPLGRIQNLFSKDLDEVDCQLPITLECMLEDSCTLMFAILFICLVFPWFVIPLIILSVLYFTVSRIFRVAVRDLKRLENVSRSPIFSSVAATVQGLSTIHAFGKENDFISKFTTTFDQNTTCLYMATIGIRWLALRIDSLSVIITGITAFLAISLHGQVSPALAGLAIAYAATISGIFQYVIRMISEAETRFISVERINSYMTTLKIEGGNGPKGKPPSDWPQRGSIRFNNVCLKYRSGLPIVLKDVSFKIQPGEKIGIVGRTGSGKSSLTVALFRLVELHSGSVKIDHLDISTLDLEQLRSHLSIIPQDPVLFVGTIRSNLDPFNQSSDSELWSVLEKTQLKDRVSAMQGQLEARVGYSGDNLSVGERQLLCLGRAMLRKTKILVLDEATAAVDPDTEAAVQSTINCEFKECTVLTIAHRLTTVLSCDRVLVMENGMVVELDKPSDLMERSDSRLAQMIAASKEGNMFIS